MQNLEKDWIEQAVEDWRKSNTKLQQGLSTNEILDIQHLLAFKFPQDFTDFYEKINGFEDLDWNEHMFSIWSLDRILKECHEQGSETFIPFSDFLIDSYRIGFAKKDKKIYKDYDLSEPIAHSFKEAIMLINSDAMLI
jgi:hypothetical protein